MKRSTIANGFAIATLTALALDIAPTANAHDKGCSNATLKGTYSHNAIGFATTPTGALPVAGVSTITFDGNGALTETGVLSQNGNIIPPQTDSALAQTVNATGTYTVNPDCTGSYTVQIPEIKLNGHGFFVIDDNGNEFQTIQTDPGTVVTGVVRRQFPVARRRDEAHSGDDWKQ